MPGDLSDFYGPLVEWIQDQPSRTALGDVNIRPFCEAHGLDNESAWALLRQCKQEGLIEDRHSTMGSPVATLTSFGRAWVKDRRERRGNRVLRMAAARNGLLRWLWEQSQDGVCMPDVADVLQHPSSLFEGDRLTPREIDQAAASLAARGLIVGITVDEYEGPIKAELTDEGKRCVEQYGGDVSEYEKQQQSGGTTFNFGGDNKGAITSHSPYAQIHVTINEGFESADIVKLMVGIREAMPSMEVVGDVQTALVNLIDEVETEAASSEANPGRLRGKLQRLGEMLNSPFVGGTLASILASNVLALAAALN